jgi:alpha-galactosidase
MNLPVHVRQGGIMQDIANRFITIHNEEENLQVSGMVLNNCGVRLKSAYAGCGFGNDGQIRVQRSGDTRMYLMEKMQK